MPNITQWVAAGLHSAQYTPRMANGAPAGFANLALTDTGDSSNMRLLIGAVSAPSPLPSSTHVRPRGEDGYTGDFIFNAAPNDFNIGFEGFDGDLSTILNKETLVTLGEWDFVPEGGSVDFQDGMWLFSRRAQSKEAGSTETGYENLLVLSSSGRLEPGNMEWQGIGAINAAATATPVQTNMFGQSVLSTYGKQSIYSLRWFSEYPTSIAVLISDGTEDTIQLGFTPINTAKTKAVRYDTGAPLTVSSVNTSTDEAVLSAAPTTGIAIICLYETSDI